MSRVSRNLHGSKNLNRTHLLVFLGGLETFSSLCRFLGALTVKLDRLLDLLDSSSLSKSNFQKPPFPGSSLDLGCFTKHLFNDKLCRMEF